MPNAVLDILIPFIRAEQAQTHRIEAEMDGKPLTLGGTGYLLGQLIRQYASRRSGNISPKRHGNCGIR